MKTRTLVIALGTMLALSVPYAASAKQTPNHGKSSKAKVAALRGASHKHSGTGPLRLVVPKIIRVAPGSPAPVAEPIVANCDPDGINCGTVPVTDASSTVSSPQTTPALSPPAVDDCLESMSGCTDQEYCQFWGFSYCEVWGFNTDVAAPAPVGDAGAPANQG
jgi:hypothetical protein